MPSLQRAVRRWKAMALAGWGILAFVVLAAVVIGGSLVVRAHRERDRAEQARQEVLFQKEKAKQAEEGDKR